MAVTGRQKALKDAFIETRGFWNPFWESMLGLDADFFEAYLAFAAVPWKSGPLEPKVKEFIYVAVDSSTTHLYIPGLRAHMRKAIEYGATRAELMEVLQLTSVLGIHSCTEGVPVLLQELEDAGQKVEMSLDPARQQLKDDFIAARGYWNVFWDGVLVLDPAYFEAYLRFSSVPWTTGTLEPKIKELIYVAIDAATTHLYIPGLRQHIRNAIGYGATKAEIMEVFELASVVGIHSCTEGVPVLLEEAANAGI
jgi:alkylhydroperoxidase/carboxymuconolactone decarboxylase family protein YurZ